MDLQISLAYKSCPRCRLLKETTEFQRNRATKDGLQIHCRPCFNEMARQRRKTTPPVFSEKQCSRCNRILGAELFRSFRAECKECERSDRLQRYVSRSAAWRRTEGTKLCVHCQAIKSTVEFRREPGTPDGLSYSCLVCTKVYRANYHAKNREMENAANRLRAKANPNATLASRRAYYRNNRRKLLDVASARHAANPEFSRIRAGRRRAILRSAILGDQQAVAAFYALVKNSETINCHWCGEVTEKQGRHVDHIIPLAKGGTHSVDNLCCSCATCNFSKGSKLPEEFMRSPRCMGDNWRAL
jgi:5-methylcytosine-specific restriction endonuclease McrA